MWLGAEYIAVDCKKKGLDNAFHGYGMFMHCITLCMKKACKKEKQEI
jgi:hypothetical protein